VSQGIATLTACESVNANRERERIAASQTLRAVYGYERPPEAGKILQTETLSYTTFGVSGSGSFETASRGPGTSASSTRKLAGFVIGGSTTKVLARQTDYTALPVETALRNPWRSSSQAAS
jgi:hypothetical protein